MYFVKSKSVALQGLFTILSFWFIYHGLKLINWQVKLVGFGLVISALNEYGAWLKFRFINDLLDYLIIFYISFSKPIIYQ